MCLSPHYFAKRTAVLTIFCRATLQKPKHAADFSSFLLRPLDNRLILLSRLALGCLYYRKVELNPWPRSGPLMFGASWEVAVLGAMASNCPAPYTSKDVTVHVVEYPRADHMSVIVCPWPLERPPSSQDWIELGKSGPSRGHDLAGRGVRLFFQDSPHVCLEFFDGPSNGHFAFL